MMVPWWYAYQPSCQNPLLAPSVEPYTRQWAIDCQCVCPHIRLTSSADWDWFYRLAGEEGLEVCLNETQVGKGGQVGGSKKWMDSSWEGLMDELRLIRQNLARFADAEVRHVQFDQEALHRPNQSDYTSWEDYRDDCVEWSRWHRMLVDAVHERWPEAQVQFYFSGHARKYMAPDFAEVDVRGYDNVSFSLYHAFNTPHAYEVMSAARTSRWPPHRVSGGERHRLLAWLSPASYNRDGKWQWNYPSEDHDELFAGQEKLARLAKHGDSYRLKAADQFYVYEPLQHLDLEYFYRWWSMFRQVVLDLGPLEEDIAPPGDTQQPGPPDQPAPRPPEDEDQKKNPQPGPPDQPLSPRGHEIGGVEPAGEFEHEPDEDADAS